MGEFEGREETKKERLERIKKEEDERMRYFEERDKRLEELEKLTIDELKEKGKKLKEERVLYLEKARMDENIISVLLGAKKAISIYEKKGARDLYKSLIKSEYDQPF